MPSGAADLHTRPTGEDALTIGGDRSGQLTQNWSRAPYVLNKVYRRSFDAVKKRPTFATKDLSVLAAQRLPRRRFTIARVVFLNTQCLFAQAKRPHVSYLQGATRRGLVAHRCKLCLALARLALAGVSLALALHAGRLIMAAALGLREHAIALDLANEMLEGRLERLTLANQNLTHSVLTQPCGHAQQSAATALLSLSAAFYGEARRSTISAAIRLSLSHLSRRFRRFSLLVRAGDTIRFAE